MSFDKSKMEGEDGKYTLATDEDFDDFVKACDEDDGWHLVTEDKKTGTKVWDKVSKDSPINMVKVYAKFPELNSLVLYDTLHDPDYRKTWDDSMAEGTELQVLDDNNDVGYYAAKAPMGVTNRDFVNQRMWRVREEEGEFIIMNHSVKHKDRPDPMKGYLRAISIRSGYLVRGDLDGDSCEMLYITQADMMGWVPAWLMNKITKTFAPNAIGKLAKAGANYVEWKAKNNPDEHKWRPDFGAGAADGKKEKKSKKSKKGKKSSSKKSKKESGEGAGKEESESD